jgi:hypothetical protein
MSLEDRVDSSVDVIGVNDVSVTKDRDLGLSTELNGQAGSSPGCHGSGLDSIPVLHAI